VYQAQNKGKKEMEKKERKKERKKKKEKILRYLKFPSLSFF